MCSQCSEAEDTELDLFVPFVLPDSRNNIDPEPSYFEEDTAGSEPCPEYETSANDLPPNYTEAHQVKPKATSAQTSRLATTIRKLGRFVCGPQFDDNELSDREDWMG